MNEKTAKNISKFLSLVLRHSPQTIGLKLDENGWADVEELIAKCSRNGNVLNKELLDYVVENNDKKRFAFNEDKTKIRASQGHSVTVELNLRIVEPLDYLYHGTVQASIDAIKEKGLQKMSRQHVHLSKDRETAIKVGSRRGVPQILTIKSGEMFRDGFTFYLSENNVWLTDEVPVKYIEFPS
ncbi:RNA 2'-phosphotransferase [Flavobacterium sp. Fl-77]|uniref:Probable RNA 2'-phosphotransferase n=1 Tax=Flavobacterium flavipigmentatum TaxID=2893884 RepID=A0AAJ2VWQ0_9FLAO|nr:MULTISPECIES: RNA 2'-phosphotransferase [unclassified Flavobacterium]MDX6180765.1 RNA 2'-phosphotransferase [Flavobacterium sp. Fl-33]MDX6184365.1 RNA 2'-phosphotransferase [Flavobacterium sp. Fl-77]UFH39474.1 RNA 2'-phosphotransferase [Flavobacterium sp. F-70]